MWKQFIPYIMLGVFLFITSGISVYWSYCKLTRMKNIKVNIPFGLDLDKDNDQKKSIRQHPAFFASTERLGVIPEIDSLDIVSAQSSMVASMNSSRKGSLQSQHSDATAVIQEDVIQLDPTLGSSLYTGVLLKNHIFISKYDYKFLILFRISLYILY